MDGEEEDERLRKGKGKGGMNPMNPQTASCTPSKDDKEDMVQTQGPIDRRASQVGGVGRVAFLVEDRDQPHGR